MVIVFDQLENHKGRGRDPVALALDSLRLSPELLYDFHNKLVDKLHIESSYYNRSIIVL